jgi:cation diffusion facilitator CzcD-associated flavoprotein CzcO
VTKDADVVVVGAGQAGLAVGYYLRRTDLTFVIFDDQPGPGGAWRHGWDSLRLFSPAQWSSLPGRLLTQRTEAEYPHRDDVLDYLAWYEQHYQLPIERPVRVEAVRRTGDRLRVETDRGAWSARAVVSATGTWTRPIIPDYAGRDRFAGDQIHSSRYTRPERFAGRRVLVVGGGNSGAQIMAEVAPLARATWVTLEPPHFLPDDVDGRVLFDQATQRYRARQEGRDPGPTYTLGDIVVIPPVFAARERGDLEAVRPFTRFTESGVVWPDGREEPIDAVIWCTGFEPALDHLRPLGVVGADSRVRTEGTRASSDPGLWLVGYGTWTGFASATLIGVGRTARATVDEIVQALAPGR